MDIATCKGGDCPLKEHCLRYTIKREFHYSQFVGIPYDKKKYECKHFKDNSLNENNSTG